MDIHVLIGAGSYFVLGLALVIPLTLLYLKRPKISLGSESHKDIIDNIDQEQELINVLRTKRDFTEGSNLSVYEQDVIKTFYLKLKEKDKISVMFELLRDSKDLPTIEKVMTFLETVEIQFHAYSSKEEVYKCIMNSIKDNPKLKQWVIDHFKRGLGYQLNKTVIIWFPMVHRLSEWVEQHQVVDVLKNMYKIMSVHWDNLKDISFFLTFRHFCKYILVSFSNDYHIIEHLIGA